VVSTPSDDSESRVLIVDDDPEVAADLADALAEYDSVAVDDAKSAIELLANDKSFAVVLCNVMVPDLTGIVVYDQATRLDPGLASRFIFMTGGAFTTNARELAARVHERLLEKPFTAEHLHFLVERVAREEAPARRRASAG
ncbi:MAG: response regulator, partial [Polyangiales bacterium]